MLAEEDRVWDGIDELNDTSLLIVMLDDKLDGYKHISGEGSKDILCTDQKMRWKGRWRCIDSKSRMERFERHLESTTKE